MARAAKHMSSVKMRAGVGGGGALTQIIWGRFSAMTRALTLACSLLVVHPVFMPLFCSASVCAAGLQAILPGYLKARFVQAALSYVGCNEEGQFVCKDGDCWCRCAAEYPQCNCPEVELRAMEASLSKIRDSWNAANRDFEESGW